MFKKLFILPIALIVTLPTYPLLKKWREERQEQRATATIPLVVSLEASAFDAAPIRVTVGSDENMTANTQIIDLDSNTPSKTISILKHGDAFYIKAHAQPGSALPNAQTYTRRLSFGPLTNQFNVSIRLKSTIGSGKQLRFSFDRE